MSRQPNTYQLATFAPPPAPPQLTATASTPVHAALSPPPSPPSPPTSAQASSSVKSATTPQSASVSSLASLSAPSSGQPAAQSAAASQSGATAFTALASQQAATILTLKTRFTSKAPPKLTPAPNQSWKPLTLRLPFLATLLLVTVAMIAALEYLHQISKGYNSGGVAFGATAEEISSTATFVYLYLPTLIAVMYAMIWTWVDLDVKRLEPWFRLSRPHGTTAEDSILLHYPFDFGPFVPFKSARRRHWAVFISSSAAVLITIVIVPLQAAIFTKGTIQRNQQTQMVINETLAPADQQYSLLGGHFLETAYGVSWLDQRMPPYATKEFALVPFCPVNIYRKPASNATWSATTQMYWTNLTCVAGSAKESPSAWEAILLDDGGGCQAQYKHEPVNFVMHGEYAVDYVPFQFSKESCTGKKSSSQFLLLTRRNRNATLIPHFCTSSYYTRSVEAIVESLTGVVHSVSHFTEPLPLTSAQFNLTYFESTIGNGVAESPATLEITSVNHNNRIRRAGLKVNTFGYGKYVNQVLGNALAVHVPPYTTINSTIKTNDTELDLLQKAVFKAHQLMFSLATSQLLRPRNDTETKGSSLVAPRYADGQVSDTVDAIVYVRLYAVIIEVCLGIVGITIMSLWLYNLQHPSKLTSDPGCISAVMALIKDSHVLHHEFKDHGSCSKHELQKRVAGRTFALESPETAPSGQTMLKIVDDLESTPLTPMLCAISDDFQAVRPWELNLPAIVAGVAIIGGALLGISYLFSQVQKSNGLVRPTDDNRILGLLENVLPVAFSSILEPCWIIFNRLLCTLQPFKDMRKQPANARQSIKAKYTTVPPPLAVWRAFRLKHFLLALVCAATLSINALAVSLGGLFKEARVTNRSPITAEALYSGRLDFSGSFERIIVSSPDGERGNLFLDHFFRLIANRSGEAPLPNWVDNDRYYLPFQIPANTSLVTSGGSSAITGYSAITRGFGVDLSCHDLQSFDDSTKLVWEVFSNGRASLGISHQKRPGLTFTCGSWVNKRGAQGAAMNDVPDGSAAMEKFISLRAAPNHEAFQGAAWDEAREYCQQLFLAGWVRVSPQYSEANTTGRDMESNFILCKPALTVGTFNVTVSPSSAVISAERMPESYDKDLSVDYKDDLPSINLFMAPMYSNQQNINWHGDSLPRDWFSASIAARMKSNRFLDPSQPPPSIEDAIAETTAAYRSLAALYMSFDTNIFTNATTSTPQVVEVMYTEKRIFMTPVMYWIAAGLLAFQIIVLIMYCFSPHEKFLPRMPTNIASTVADVAVSHATQNAGTSFEDRKTYMYGYFIGTDGAGHVGIDEAERVRPLRPQ